MRVHKISKKQLIFERYDENDKAIVIVSRVNQETEVNIPEEYKNAKIVFCTEGSSKTTLAPYGAIVLKK